METSRNALARSPLFELKASLGPLWPVTSKDPARHLTKIRKKMRGLSSLLFRKTEMGGGETHKTSKNIWSQKTVHSKVKAQELHSHIYVFPTLQNKPTSHPQILPRHDGAALGSALPSSPSTKLRQ